MLVADTVRELKVHERVPSLLMIMKKDGILENLHNGVIYTNLGTPYCLTVDEIYLHKGVIYTNLGPPHCLELDQRY